MSDVPREQEDDPPGASTVVSDLIRCHLLVTVFDSDPEKWLLFLASSGTPEQRRDDYPFVIWLQAKMREDPKFIRRVEALVCTSAEILFRLDVVKWMH